MKYFHELLSQYSNNLPVGMIIKVEDYDEIIDNRDPNARAKPTKTKTILVGDCSSTGGISNHCRIESSTKIKSTNIVSLNDIEWLDDPNHNDFDNLADEFKFLTSTMFNPFYKTCKVGLVVDLGKGSKKQFLIMGNISPNGGLCDASMLKEISDDLPVMRYGFLRY